MNACKRRELMGPYTEFDLFGSLCHPRKIGVFYLIIQKTRSTELIFLGAMDSSPFMAIWS